MAITQNERKSIGMLFEALTTAQAPKQAHENVLRAINSLSGAVCGHIADIAETVEQKQLVDITLGDTAMSRPLANDHPEYIWKNPIWPYLPTFEGSVLQQIELVGGWGQWRNCEFYHDFMRKHRVDDGIAMFFRDPAGEYSYGIGLMHNERGGFKKSTVELLEFLSPYVARGLRNLERWNAGEGIDEMRPDQLRVVVRSGKLIHATHAAAKVLGLSRQGAQTNPALAELLRLSPTALLPGSTVQWKSPAGKSYRLVALRSAQDPALLFMQLQPHVFDTSYNPDFAAALKAGLTPRQALIFSCMARGLSYKQIALELKASFNTIRAHVRHIYARLRVTGYVEAINAVRQTKEKLPPKNS